MYMTFAELWEICIEFMWDEQYLHSLDQFLRSHNVGTILDCAGGTGFPCVELHRRNWNITYSDGSAQMVAFFKNKIQTAQIAIPHYQVNWLELSTRLPQRFDAVLCRGNSLVYVNSWDEDKIGERAGENIRKSLQEFFNVLNLGGILYVDTINKREFHRPTYPEIMVLGEKKIHGKSVSLTLEVTHEERSRRRIWKSIMLVDGVRHEFRLISYLLRHDELVAMMRDVGFKDVQETAIFGEKNYNVFVGLK